MNRMLKLILLLSILIISTPARTDGAVDLINDTFVDNSRIDLVHTTAEVDTENGWVTLGLKNLTNSLILYKDNYEITLINNDAVETYQYNGTNMELNHRRSINGGLNEPISIAGSSGEYIVLEKDTNEASWYHFDGTGMVKNGSLSISALTDPKALDVITGTYDFALLDGNQIKRYNYDGTGMVQISPLSFCITGGNPIGISIENEGYTTLILDKVYKKIFCYCFNGTSISKESTKSLERAGELIKPTSLSADKDGGLYLITDGNSIKAYNYTGSAMIYNPLLSLEGLNRPLAVAIKPGLYDYAVLIHDANDHPQVAYYAFNGTGMEEVEQLKITGLEDIPYANDQVLRGRDIDVGHGISALKLQAEVELPAGTSITWEVTVDGINWNNAVIGNKVTFAVPGNKPNYRATLHTDDKMITPKILSVQLLDASLSVSSLQILNIIGPAIPGNPELPTKSQVMIWSGYNVTFQIETAGSAECVVADIYIDKDIITLSSETGDLVRTYPLESFSNIWTGTFHTDAKTARGTLLDVFFRAKYGTEFVTAGYPDFALVYDSALELHEIHLTH